MKKNTEKNNKVNYLQSGLGSRTGVKNKENLALVIGYVIGNLGGQISIKNEYKELTINK